MVCYPVETSVLWRDGAVRVVRDGPIRGGICRWEKKGSPKTGALGCRVRRSGLAGGYLAWRVSPSIAASSTKAAWKTWAKAAAAGGPKRCRW